jgi:hypothetical protein
LLPFTGGFSAPPQRFYSLRLEQLSILIQLITYTGEVQWTADQNEFYGVKMAEFIIVRVQL